MSSHSCHTVIFFIIHAIIIYGIYFNIFILVQFYESSDVVRMRMRQNPGIDLTTVLPDDLFHLSGYLFGTAINDNQFSLLLLKV